MKAETISTIKEITEIQRRRGFIALHEFMATIGNETPYAIVWQIHDENGYPDYSTMTNCWDIDHSNKADNPAEIVNDHEKQNVG